MRECRRWFLRGNRKRSRKQVHRRLRIVGETEEVQIFGTDHLMTCERVKIDDLFPVFASIKKNQDAPVELSGLLQRQDLGHLVERAEAARKHYQRARQMSEPQLTHEEIMELERQSARDVAIGPLLVRQSDVEPDGPAA